MLDKDTVESLARGLVEIIDQINAFYSDPTNEAAYQKWLGEKYGYSINGSLDTINSPLDKKRPTPLKRHSP